MVAPLHPSLWPEQPWVCIHMDYAGPFRRKTFLLIVDTHSKWPVRSDLEMTVMSWKPIVRQKRNPSLGIFDSSYLILVLQNASLRDLDRVFRTRLAEASKYQSKHSTSKKVHNLLISPYESMVMSANWIWWISTHVGIALHVVNCFVVAHYRVYLVIQQVRVVVHFTQCFE